MGLRSQNLLTDTDINSWGFEGQTKIARLLKWYRVSDATQGTTAGQREYSFPNDSSGRAITIERVLHNTLELTQTSTDELGRWNYYWWRDANGTPLFWYVRGTTEFGLYPTPANTDPAALQLIWTGLPPAPTSDSDFYYAPYSLEEGIILWAKLQAARKDSSGEGAHRLADFNMAWKEFVVEARQEAESAAYGQAAVMGAENDVRPYRPWLFDPYKVISGPG